MLQSAICGTLIIKENWRQQEKKNWRNEINEGSFEVLNSLTHGLSRFTIKLKTALILQCSIWGSPWTKHYLCVRYNEQA